MYGIRIIIRMNALLYVEQHGNHAITVKKIINMFVTLRTIEQLAVALRYYGLAQSYGIDHEYRTLINQAAAEASEKLGMTLYSIHIPGYIFRDGKEII